MADQVTCSCPACRVADHAATISTEERGIHSHVDAAGLLLAAVVKVGRRAGWSEHQIAVLVLRTGGELLAQHLAQAQTSQPHPVPPAPAGSLH